MTGLDGILRNEDREATCRHDRTLAELTIRLSELPWDVGELSLLCSSGGQFHSAKSYPGAGIIELCEPLLSKPPEIIWAVLVHETVHMTVGDSIRRAIAARYPKFEQFLHTRILPDWLRGRVAVAVDSDFVQSKGWEQLYDGWIGPLDSKTPLAADAAVRYFELLEHNVLDSRDRRIGMTIRWERIGTHIQSTRSKPPASVAERYDAGPDTVALECLTGYALSEYLTDSCRAAESYRLGSDIGDLEEGLANYIAPLLTGVELDELQRWARQDEHKLQIARRIASKNPGIQQAIDAMASFEALYLFCNAVGRAAV